MLMLCAYGRLQGQTRLSTQPLTIGDTIPDITLGNLYNYPAKTAKLSAFKGKVVILDFWATWCGSCLKAFPKMMAAQQQYNNSLQVIMVGADPADNKEQLHSFFKKRQGITGKPFTLPCVLQDTLLRSYFPFTSIPQYVWLDDNRVINAITTAEEVTEENIQRFVADKKIALATKNDNLLFDASKPFLVNGNGSNNGNFVYRSVFTPSQQNLGSTVAIKSGSDDKITRYSIINYTLKAMLQQAFPAVSDVRANRFVANDSMDLSFLDSVFCYEINTRPVSKTVLQRYMQEDISRAFGIQVTKEKRLFNCYVLSLADTLKLPLTKGKTPFVALDGETDFSQFQNQPAGTLANYLENILKAPVLLDERCQAMLLDVQFPKGFAAWQYPQIKSFLATIGFYITQSRQQLDAVVVYPTLNN